MWDSERYQEYVREQDLAACWPPIPLFVVDVVVVVVVDTMN